MYRSDVARALGCTTGNVARLTRVGQLTTVGKDHRGWLLYDPVQVQRLAQKVKIRQRRTKKEMGLAWTYGELSARAFEAFKAGKSIEEIVIELRVSPDLARQLYHQFCTPLGQPIGRMGARGKDPLQAAEDAERKQQLEWEREFNMMGASIRYPGR